jgi:hypothetical protein
VNTTSGGNLPGAQVKVTALDPAAPTVAMANPVIAAVDVCAGATSRRDDDSVDAW